MLPASGSTTGLTAVAVNPLSLPFGTGTNVLPANQLLELNSYDIEVSAATIITIVGTTSGRLLATHEFNGAGGITKPPAHGHNYGFTTPGEGITINSSNSVTFSWNLGIVPKGFP